MTRTRKLVVIAAVIVVAISTIALWPKPRGYTYQGKTVEQWFGECCQILVSDEALSSDPYAACVLMGTNAVPFLTCQSTQNLEPSLIEVWAQKLPKRVRPNLYRRAGRAHVAELILGSIQRAETNSPPTSRSP